LRVFTLVEPAMLAQARVMVRSLERHQPGWSTDVLLLGYEPAATLPAGFPPARPVTDELDVDLELLLCRHDAHEATMLLLPRLLELHARSDRGPAIHLPPTAWALDGLQPLQQALDTSPLMLAPRALTDVPADGLQPDREQLESAGRVSETLIGIDRSGASIGFLGWYREHVEGTFGSPDRGEAGARPEDRPWLARLLELAPARFGAAMLEDPGCNVSLWNLHERSLGAAEEGIFVNGHWPLRLLDLPGFDPTRPHRLAALASRARLSRSPVLGQLSERYAEELTEAGWQALDRRHEIGRRLANGLLYDQAVHSLRVLAEALGERYGDVFDEHGTDAFVSWLRGPAPEGGEHGITRYVYCRVARERPDVMHAYPHLDGADGAAYVQWCWAFGQDELEIPDQFMPPAASGQPRGRSTNASATPPPAPPGPALSGGPGAPDGVPGVRITGYMGHSLGLGAAARGYAEALEAAGVPVSTASVPLHHLELPVELEQGYGLHGFEERVGGRSGHDVEIVAVNADELPAFVERLGGDYFRGPRVGVWGWETNSIPPRWQAAFELVDEVWVYSRFMSNNVGAVAPVPVVALPPPVQAPDPAPAPIRLGLPDGDFLFLFVFDYLSTIERKNPVGLVEAFKRAFAPGEGPRLLIKTINGPLRPLSEEAVLWSATGRPDVHVVDRSLSAQERDALMAGCDCYVSLHRSEGFGLTLAEAMAAGKPVIGTGYSGNLDFMSEENSYLVDYELTRVGPECEIYPPDGEWAEPDLDHAAFLMRAVHEDREEASRRGSRARRDIAETLSAKATGEAMRGRLRELAPGTTATRTVGAGSAN
jgi:glycosyltransferase involved in cell wall biosynthesis